MNRQSLIDKIKHDLAAGRVVAIAGTGVSVAACGNQAAAGFQVATWSGLLLHGVKHCRDIGAINDKVAGILRGQIESGETDFLILAAEMISQRLQGKSEGVYRGWLQESIGRLEAQEGAVLEALARGWKDDPETMAIVKARRGP